MKADPQTEAEVINVINQLIKAFNERNLDAGLELFAQDPDVIFIGSGVDEKCIGVAEIKAEFERAFKQSEESSIELGWYSVSSAGSVAWVAGDADIKAKVGSQEIGFSVRMTHVLEKRNGKWLVVQSHDSLPAAGQKEGESWPTS